MKKTLLALLALSYTLSAQTKDNLDDLSLEELMDIKIYSATKSYQRIEEIPANIIVPLQSPQHSLDEVGFLGRLI